MRFWLGSMALVQLPGGYGWGFARYVACLIGGTGDKLADAFVRHSYMPVIYRMKAQRHGQRQKLLFARKTMDRSPLLLKSPSYILIPKNNLLICLIGALDTRFSLYMTPREVYMIRHHTLLFATQHSPPDTQRSPPGIQYSPSNI